MLRHHEIAEADHRILNLFTDQRLALLGEVYRLRTGQRLLDLASGKGELLCRWARVHRIAGSRSLAAQPEPADPGGPATPTAGWPGR